MHKLITVLIFVTLTLVSHCVIADVDPWRESYRLENLYQYDAAINALNNAGSDSELVLLRRGWLNYLKGSHSKAIDYYTKAMSKNSHSLDARLGIILPLLAQQRWREAATNANKVLEMAPWNYYAHIRLMIAEQALKQWQQLEKHARAVSERYPTDAEALVFQARANRYLGNDKQAAQLYGKVLELIPDHIEARQYVE